MKRFSMSSFTYFIQHPAQFAVNLETHILHEIIKNYGDYQSRNKKYIHVYIYIHFTITCYEYSITMVIISHRIKNIYMYIYIHFTITCYEYSITMVIISHGIKNIYMYIYISQ